MNQVEQIKTRDCLAQPMQDRVDVPLNGGVLIVPMDFIPLTGVTTNMCEEFIVPDGIKKYRFVKQISSFGDVKLFDYYEAEVSEGPIRDKLDLEFGLDAAHRHNIKIANTHSSKHVTGLYGYVEIVDAKHCDDNFYIKIKTVYGEIPWQKV